MIGASKLDDLYKELEPVAGRKVLDIQSRAKVAFITETERLLQRTWQQEDLYILSAWLPHGVISVLLNLNQYYKVPTDLDYYLPLMQDCATDESENRRLLSIYLAFALIKNFLLLQKVRVDTALANKEDVISGCQSLNFALFSSAKGAILPYAAIVKDKLSRLGRAELAHGLFAEIVDEFKSREAEIQSLLNSDKCVVGTPVPRQVQTPPIQQKTVPARREDGPSPSITVNFIPDYPRRPFAPPPPPVSMHESTMSDDPLDCLARAPSLCLMFSSCLPFLQPEVRREQEMAELSTADIAARRRDGYMALHDQGSDVDGASPSGRGRGGQPWV